MALALCCSRALERKSRIISGPTNFSHIEHMGPDQGMKALIELPTVITSSQVFVFMWSILCLLDVDLAERSICLVVEYLQWGYCSGMNTEFMFNVVLLHTCSCVAFFLSSYIFWPAPLGVRRAKSGHQSLGWTMLSHVSDKRRAWTIAG